MVRPRLMVSLVRTTLLLLALAALSAVVWQLVRAPLAEVRSVVTSGGPDALLDLPVDRDLAALSAAALAGCWAWLALSVVLVVVDVLASPLAGAARAGGLRLARRCVPRGVRRIVLALCGAALAGSLAAPAHAETPTHPRTDGLAVPDRVTGGPPAPSVVTVRAGDTLWAIAARTLPSDATTAEIAAGWRRIARANADRLAVGPDLIFPGTRLRLPLEPKGDQNVEDHQ